MANQLLTISKITREMLAILENNLVMAKAVNRQYDSQFANREGKIGASLNVRKPVRHVVKSGPALQVGDVTETYVPVTISNQEHVDIAFTSSDLSLHIDDFSQRYLKTAAAALANKVDLTLHQLYKKIPDMVGTPGTVPNAVSFPLAARRRLNENAAPLDDDRSLVVNPETEASIVGALTNLFNPSGTISRQFTRGAMGDNTLGFNWAMDQNVAVHTYGTSTSAANPTVNGAQAGATGPGTDTSASFALTVNAVTGTITAGTVVTISNVFAVNPQSRQSTGVLKQFVVTDDVANAATTINIFPPPIFATGGVTNAYQNVTSSTNNIANGATVTLPNASGSLQHAQNLAFHRDAFTLATADLPLPGGVDMASRDNYKGISLRMVRQYDINSDQFLCRCDILYGMAALYPELATRLTA